MALWSKKLIEYFLLEAAILIDYLLVKMWKTQWKDHNICVNIYDKNDRGIVCFVVILPRSISGGKVDCTEIMALRNLIAS